MEETEKVILPTTDLKHSFTLDAVRALFTFCTDPVEKFAERYKLSPTIVAAYVREGRWEEMRAAHTEKAMALFRTATSSTVEDSLDIELKLQSLRNIQLEQQVNQIANYYAKYGHLFAVNERDGNQLKDMYGLPIPIRIPYTMKAAHDLIESLRVKLEELAKEQQIIQKNTQTGTIALSDYKHLLAPRKKDE